MLNADTYAVKSSATSGSGFSTLASGLTTSSHVDTGLTNGTPRFYLVNATNSTGTSADSSEASATPAAATSLDDDWDQMVAAMTFTESNYMANCDTFDQWYQDNTGYDTDGVTLGDLTPETAADELFVRAGEGGTQSNPTIIEGMRGGPARWQDNWITYRHCLIDNIGTYGSYASPTYGSGYYGIRFENCTFIQSPASDRDCCLINSPGGPGDYFGNTFIQCEIQGFGGGLKATGGLYAKYCYIHDMQESSVGGQHVTCSTARAGRHHLIRCMGTDGGSGMFNVYHESDCSDMLFEENIAIGMSPNATASYGMDNAKGSQGYAANATNMRWINNMTGKYGNPPVPANYAGIQYGAFSTTDGLNFGPGGNATRSGNFYIADGSSW